MAVTIDYYKVLGIKRDATAARIKAAFRARVMRYHPDHNPGREAWANKKLKSILEAYEILGDAAARRLYDRRLAYAERRLAETERRVVPRKPRPPEKTTAQRMADIMNFPLTPSWARSMAFAYLLFDRFSKDDGSAE
jgi:curved DNA-binding protein CbpA